MCLQQVVGMCLVGLTASVSALNMTVHAQTVIDVNTGQALQRSDLDAGSFQGTDFTLGPDTTFQINHGGAIAPMGNALFFDFVDFGGSVINLNDGGRFEGPSAILDVQIDVSDGGEVGESVSIATDGELHLNGGTLGEQFFADFGSTINLNDGLVESGFNASGGTVNLRGGRIAGPFQLRSGSTLNLFGGEFRLNGQPITALPNGLGDQDVLTATLSNGQVAILSDQTLDVIESFVTTTFNVTPLDPVHSTPIEIDSGGGSSKGLRPGEQIILSASGSLPDHYRAAHATLDIAGGQVGRNLRTAYSQVNITGGEVGDGFRALKGSIVNLDGGSIGSDFVVYQGATVNLRGGPVGARAFADQGSVVNLFAGTLPADFATLGDLNVHGGRVGNDHSLGGNVTVHDGQLGDDVQINGTLNMQGGEVGDRPKINGSVFVSAGRIGDGVEVLQGKRIEVSGGQVGDDLLLREGSTLRVSGGSVGGNIFAEENTTIKVTGGSVGPNFGQRILDIAEAGGDTTIEGMNFHLSGGRLGPNAYMPVGSTFLMTGGRLGGNFQGNEYLTFAGGIIEPRALFQTSDLTILGNEFRIDNKPVPGEGRIRNYGYEGVVSGVFPDGHVFIFDDELFAGRWFLETTDIPDYDTTPITVTADEGRTLGLRPGQTLTLAGDNAWLRDDYAAVDATLNVQAGNVGKRLETISTDLTITGGSIGPEARLHRGRIVIDSGTIGADARIIRSETTMTGGVLGPSAEISGGSFTMLGGNLSGDFIQFVDSVINLHGGETGLLKLFADNTLNLFVRQAWLDGQPLNLDVGQTMRIDQRGDILLEARLEDGSYFDLWLEPVYYTLATKDFASRYTSVYLHGVVPEPTSALLMAAGAAIIMRRSGTAAPRHRSMKQTGHH